jgi:LuxR family transcriptional regulator, quorum-sensing system regulator LasR
MRDILSSKQQSDPVELASFTAREIECLKRVAAGKTDLEIAQILHLSRKTVFFHISGATQRINASSRFHAVANAFRMGLIN